jgi:hypothetical protein
MWNILDDFVEKMMNFRGKQKFYLLFRDGQVKINVRKREKKRGHCQAARTYLQAHMETLRKGELSTGKAGA